MRVCWSLACVSLFSALDFGLGLLVVAWLAECLAVEFVVGSVFGFGDDVVGDGGSCAASLAGVVVAFEDAFADAWREAGALAGPARIHARARAAWLSGGAFGFDAGCWCVEGLGFRVCGSGFGLRRVAFDHVLDPFAERGCRWVVYPGGGRCWKGDGQVLVFDHPSDIQWGERPEKSRARGGESPSLP